MYRGNNSKKGWFWRLISKYRYTKGGLYNPQPYAQKGSTMNAQSSNSPQGNSSINPEPFIPQLPNPTQQGNPLSSLPQPSNQSQGPTPSIIPSEAGSYNSPPREHTLDISLLYPHHYEFRHNILDKIDNRLLILHVY